MILLSLTSKKLDLQVGKDNFMGTEPLRRFAVFPRITAL